jgi:hypothetical protein
MPALPALPSLDRLPLNVRALIAGGLVALAAAGGYLGLLAPKYREVKTLKAQLAREVPSREPRASVAPIGEEERKLWRELEERLRGRYPGEPALPKAVGVVAELARASGMELVSLEIQTPQAGLAPRPRTALPPPPFQPPAELAVNPSTIKLVARHRYRELVAFVEGLRRVPVYVAVQSLEVKRQDNRLTTEVSFASFRWGK